MSGRQPRRGSFCNTTSILPPPCDTKTLPRLWGRSTGWSGFGLTGQTLNASDGQRDTNRNRTVPQATTSAHSHQQQTPPKPAQRQRADGGASAPPRPPEHCRRTGMGKPRRVAPTGFARAAVCQAAWNQCSRASNGRRASMMLMTQPFGLRPRSKAASTVA